MGVRWINYGKVLTAVYKGQRFEIKTITGPAWWDGKTGYLLIHWVDGHRNEYNCFSMKEASEKAEELAKEMIEKAVNEKKKDEERRKNNEKRKVF